MGSCMAFVFGVMIEFTICHFAKNQELIRCEPQPSLIVDTALSTLFGATRDIDDLDSPEAKFSEVISLPLPSFRTDNVFYIYLVAVIEHLLPFV
ncbi:unnamed protein product [Nippostrongylus brasiliensis]|uniref:Secreted protein n=1 Tax=Nippostrongylus brasiliensis TaxID=27835 RepID=A0A0N4XMU0_NIPBR|nr:unnamed protein product [Nippostrongylus brasiliensis]